MMKISDWFACLKDSVARYLDTLKMPGQLGRFLPCPRGLTREGEQVSLGFSCFALKIYYTIGLWEEVPPKEREDWIAFLKSFQADGNPMKDRVANNAFIDPPVINYLIKHVPLRKRLIERILPHKPLTDLQRVLIAETKQAIATLAQVGEAPKIPYRGFPSTSDAIKTHLEHLDWTNPWEAGAHAAALAVFLKSQAYIFLSKEETNELLSICVRFIEGVADKKTGAYFMGSTPSYDILVNGAMKILTALDWLEEKIHYPKRLIDTCLKQLPSAEGCHLVDVIYVLYQCSKQTQHHKEKIQEYCVQVLDMIKNHYNPDGGFSYYIGRSQTIYYGIPISRGLAESDLHGTCLLVWAVAMISEILDRKPMRWEIIRP